MDLAVQDNCGADMTEVEVNETFDSAVADNANMNWQFFTWTWGVWNKAQDFSDIHFTDIIFRQLQGGDDKPPAMNAGDNGFLEDAASTVMHATQKWFAASSTNGQGLSIGRNYQYHYLDHGAHK